MTDAFDGRKSVERVCRRLDTGSVDEDAMTQRRFGGDEISARYVLYIYLYLGLYYLQRDWFREKRLTHTPVLLTYCVNYLSDNATTATIEIVK